jgi:alginate O-acetyltransferase complex protein AlgI
MEEAHLLTPDGRVLRGIETVLYVAAASPLMRPLVWLARFPGVTPALRVGYRLFARNRYGITRVCGLDGERRRTRLDQTLVPFALVAGAFGAGHWMPAWVWMWTIALSIFLACKWMTWRAWGGDAGLLRTLAYFVATPGMDARAFFGARNRGGAKPQAAGEWLYSIRNIVAGALIVWVIPRAVGAALAPSILAWTGMVGAILILHFGAFHLLALAWNSRGIDAEPLMNRPTRAATLADFWGKRWNRGFSTPARELIFAPLVRRGFSATTATAIVFAVSGIVHDAVISIPARGGYGLPTVYFLIQLAGVLFERTRALRSLVRRHPWIGRAYAIVFTLAPAPLLFHGPFVHNVNVPFLHAIGGLP